MTGLGVQQTNRRMCRHVLVTLLFFCRPHDVFMQDQVPCKAGQVTVGQTARITCSFPPGTIVPKRSDFVVKKFGSSREEDILDCYYPQGSTLDNPDCLIRDTSLGYTFKFVPENDTQTVIIPSVKLSDAGEYGCDRTGHRIDRCTLTVTARVLCEAEEVTVGQRARITCIFHSGTFTPNNGGDFVVKKFPGDSKEEDILVCNHTKGSTSGTPNCVFKNKTLGYDFTFVPENDRQTVVIPSVKLSDAGEYGCYRIGHRIDRCNLNVTGDSGRESGQSHEKIELIVGLVITGVVVVAAVVVLCLCNFLKWRKVKQTLRSGQDILEMAQKNFEQLSKQPRDDAAQIADIIYYLKENQIFLGLVSLYSERVDYLLHNKQLKKLWVARSEMEDIENKNKKLKEDLEQAKNDLDQVMQDVGLQKENFKEGFQDAEQQLAGQRETAGRRNQHATAERDRERTHQSELVPLVKSLDLPKTSHAAKPADEKM